MFSPIVFLRYGMMCGNIKLPLLSVMACEERLVLIPAMPFVFTIAKYYLSQGCQSYSTLM